MLTGQVLNGFDDLVAADHGIIRTGVSGRWSQLRDGRQGNLILDRPSVNEDFLLPAAGHD